MCANAQGCFLIKAYQQNAARHGHDAALHAAARLYQRTNRAASDDEALAFVARFVQPSAAPGCSGCG
ncbi:hypothetical protein [Azospirillum sp. ST 5-10]|uniref:hypothetical protein n=1 Tax=unclassified Azospirillum TaxID=2630922 RepID=UPI003F49FC00